MIPLALLGDGESGEIIATGHVDALCASRAEDMGLRVGRRVEMLSNRAGLLLVELHGSRIAVDPGIGMRIRVRR